MPKVTAIIVAAGASVRMGQDVCKQLLPLCGRPVIFHTLRAFERAETIDEIIIVVREEDMEAITGLAGDGAVTKPTSVVSGGATRQQSVECGLRIAIDADYLAIHDGARPLVQPSEIDAVVREAFMRRAAALAVPVKNTIKRADGERRVLSTPDRSELWSMQTPQVFEAGLLRNAMQLARRRGEEYTDDCQAVERTGTPVFLCPGSYRNIKITTREDLTMAEALMGRNEGSAAIHSFRTGHGYDVHRLVEGRRLILGGVTIPYEKGLLGHSDADVLTHAIADALLGAAALGDIGLHFPDSDKKYKGADSVELLKRVCRAIRRRGYELVNVDATIVAQAPRLRPYIPQMRRRLADACGLEENQLNIKGTTEEELGFTGRGEGISAHAVCSLCFSGRESRTS